ncbi:GNAT family N-acetyltransferase [Streptomyces pseudogriseolus]|uniref:GNAT family N-acetyltransferase n=1 Tax=Streptomyces pseudogriseolus TaxID=36817 RepID=UPI003FA1B135
MRLGSTPEGRPGCSRASRHHAFVLDTVVAQRCRGHGVGTALVRAAAEGSRAAGCEWLHVDFEAHLRAFYVSACGFRETAAGLIAL